MTNGARMLQMTKCRYEVSSSFKTSSFFRQSTPVRLGPFVLRHSFTASASRVPSLALHDRLSPREREED